MSASETRAELAAHIEEVERLREQHHEQMREEFEALPGLGWQWRDSSPTAVLVSDGGATLALTNSGHLRVQGGGGDRVLFSLSLLEAMKLQLAREQALRDAEDI